MSFLSKLFFLLLILITGRLSAQCSGYPATIADADCSGGTALSNNVNANGGTYGYCGSSSSSATFSGINLNGATIRICGNATLGFGSWNSGSLVISCGATVTINSNVTLNNSCGIVNYGTLIINGSLTYQNANNFVYNELATSKITVTGNINFPTNNGTNGYLKNAGYIKVNGNYNAYAGVRTCFLNGGKLECANLVYMDHNANCNGISGNRFTFGSAGGSCIFRYITSASLYNVLTSDSRWNVYQATGSTQFIDPPCNGNPTGWGSAILVSSAPALTVPSGEQPCSTITCLTLPVELLKFFALPSSDANILSWATATETNCDYFRLERSADGVDWKLLAKIPGSGNSSERKDYSYTDLKPAKGINYYRLSQQDYNGRKRYFDPVYIDRKEMNTFSSLVYPVPANNGNVTLSLSGLEDGDLHIAASNLLGETISIDVHAEETYGDREKRYRIFLPGKEQIAFVTVFSGNTVLARHKIYILRD